jgi:hypothetical protein
MKFPGAWGALLLAAPLSLSHAFAQHHHPQSSRAPHSKLSEAAKRKPGLLLQFRLNETQEQIAAWMGPPERTAESGALYFCWQYFLGEDLHDPTHSFCFDKRDGRLAAVSRISEQPENPDALLPPASTKTYFWPDAETREYSARVRRFGKLDRLLIANGVSKPGELTTSLLLVRRSALKAFVSWIADQMEPPASACP